MTVAATAGDQVVQHRGWFIFLSLLLIVAGAAAIAFPILSTFAVELWAAITFAIAGVAQTIHAFGARSWGGFLWDLLVGLLYLAASVVLWLNPIAGARVRAEQGDAQAFRLMRLQAMAVGQRRIELSIRIAELERGESDAERGWGGTR